MAIDIFIQVSVSFMICYTFYYLGLHLDCKIDSNNDNHIQYPIIGMSNSYFLHMFPFCHIDTLFPIHISSEQRPRLLGIPSIVFQILLDPMHQLCYQEIYWRLYITTSRTSLYPAKHLRRKNLACLQSKTPEPGRCTIMEVGLQ